MIKIQKLQISMHMLLKCKDAMQTIIIYLSMFSIKYTH